MFSIREKKRSGSLRLLWRIMRCDGVSAILVAQWINFVNRSSLLIYCMSWHVEYGGQYQGNSQLWELTLLRSINDCTCIFETQHYIYIFYFITLLSSTKQIKLDLGLTCSIKAHQSLHSSGILSHFVNTNRLLLWSTILPKKYRRTHLMIQNDFYELKQHATAFWPI